MAQYFPPVVIDTSAADDIVRRTTQAAEEALSGTVDGLVTTYDTIADLKAATAVPDTKLVQLKGRDAPGDAPARTLIYDASATDTPNDLTVFAPTLLSGRFRATDDRALEAEWFGVRHVDQSASTGPEMGEQIREAVRIGAQELGERPIHLKGGAKYFTETPVVDYVQWLADNRYHGGLIGAGKAHTDIELKASILNPDGSRGALINLSGAPDSDNFETGNQRLTGWTIQGLNLISSRNILAHAVRLGRTAHTHLNDVTATNFNGNAWRLESVWDSDFNRITAFRCGSTEEEIPTLWVGKMDWSVGGGVDASNALYFIDSQITASWWDSVYVGPDTDKLQYYGKIHGRIPAQGQVAYTHVVFDGTRSCAFYGQTMMQDAQGKEGILITDRSGMRPYGNRIIGAAILGSGTGSAGIRLQGADYTVIDGNAIRLFDHGIVTEDGTMNNGKGNVIGDNSFEVNSRELIIGRSTHIAPTKVPRSHEYWHLDESKVSIRNNGNGLLLIETSTTPGATLTNTLSIGATGNIVPVSGAEVGTTASPFAKGNIGQVIGQQTDYVHADNTKAIIRNNGAGLVRIESTSTPGGAPTRALDIGPTGNLQPISGAQCGTTGAPWEVVNANRIAVSGPMQMTAYTAAELGDRTHISNTSGKVANRTCYIDSTNGQIVVARGGGATSPWVGHLATITPA